MDSRTIQASNARREQPNNGKKSRVVHGDINLRNALVAVQQAAGDRYRLGRSAAAAASARTEVAALLP